MPNRKYTLLRQSDTFDVPRDVSCIIQTGFEFNSEGINKFRTGAKLQHTARFRNITFQIHITDEYINVLLAKSVGHWRDFML